MNHAVGGGAADAFLANGDVEILVDFVEFIGRAPGLVGGIGDGPQALGEGNNGSRAAFVLVVEEGEVRIDATELTMRSFGGQESGQKGADGEEVESHGL